MYIQYILSLVLSWTTLNAPMFSINQVHLPVNIHQSDVAQTALEAPVPPEHTSPPPLPVPDPTRSFWTHGEPNANPLARQGAGVAPPEEADICIIGSGITGVSAAYHLSKALEGEKRMRPLKVVIFEARDFCSGATGRNGGHLTAARYSDFVRLKALFGTEEAKKCINIEKHTVDALLKLIKEHSLESAVDLVRGGHISLLFSEKERAEVDADIAAAQAAGLEMEGFEFYNKERVEKEFGAPFPGYHWDGSNLWPLKLVTELYKLANSSSTLSLSLHTHTPVTAITPDDSLTSSARWRLTTPNGFTSCKHVLHATNAHVAHLLPHMHGPNGVIPTRGQVLAVRGSKAIVDASYGANEGFEYWFQRPVEEGKSHPLVLIGGGREMASPAFELYQHDDSVVNSDVGTALREFLPRTFPGRFEKGREPEMEWTGIMAYTKLHDPFVGPVLDEQGVKLTNQWIAAGYSGHGMPRAFACAEAVAGMIASELAGRTWKAPDWLPTHYMTTNTTRSL